MSGAATTGGAAETPPPQWNYERRRRVRGPFAAHVTERAHCASGCIAINLRSGMSWRHLQSTTTKGPTRAERCGSILRVPGPPVPRVVPRRVPNEHEDEDYDQRRAAHRDPRPDRPFPYLVPNRV